MTLKTESGVSSTAMPEEVFPPHSGVRTLPELDPDSRVEVHKKDGTVITYQYTK